MVWRGREEGGITLSGLSAAGDADDTLSATLSGIPAGWTVKDGATLLSNGQGFAEIGRASRRERAHISVGAVALKKKTVSNAEGAGTSARERLSGTVSGVEEVSLFGA